MSLGAASLTSFIVKLLSYTDQQLAAACPDKAAAHYGISPKHAAGYIAQQREVRGIAQRRAA